MNCERCAGLLVRTNGDVAAMGFDDQPRDVEAEPQMSAVTRILHLAAHPRLENRPLTFSGYGRTEIMNAHDQSAGIVARYHHRNRFRSTIRLDSTCPILAGS